MAAAHGHQQDLSSERIKLGAGGRMVVVVALIAAVVGLVLALSGGHYERAGEKYQRFLHSYLTAYAYCLSIALGALFSVMVHHASRAGWNVTIRRTTENIAGTLPIFIILSLPILWSVVQNTGILYPWALPAPDSIREPLKETAGEKPPERAATAEQYAEERVTQVAERKIEPEIAWKRHGWYSNIFFFSRMALYLIIWAYLASKFRNQSIRQDENGDVEITTRLQALGPPGLVMLGLSITFFAFDILMSLDPAWYSTMFGVYYIAGCILSGFAAVIVGVFLLQKFGYLRSSVSVEHYHDLGKYLFAFTFFYGYIAFSQYMLLWYSSIPEEVTWYSRHGATTLHPSRWSWVILAILFGQFLIPFPALLSRHVKRNKNTLVFLAIWVLAFHYVDIYWIVMPQYGAFKPMLMDVGTLLLIGGVFVAGIVVNMSGANLRPTHDPRLPDALAFTNI
ncbi:MAG TPA: hypothetical protein VH370_11420 [Humisphaera sp.]|nr:hypothetical protein [Humisphaera sp.]